jgi:hypothetical protein
MSDQLRGQEWRERAEDKGFEVVGAKGFEPSTSWSRTVRQILQVVALASVNKMRVAWNWPTGQPGGKFCGPCIERAFGSKLRGSRGSRQTLGTAVGSSVSFFPLPAADAGMDRLELSWAFASLNGILNTIGLSDLTPFPRITACRDGKFGINCVCVLPKMLFRKPRLVSSKQVKLITVLHCVRTDLLTVAVL